MFNPDLYFKKPSFILRLRFSYNRFCDSASKEIYKCKSKNLDCMFWFYNNENADVLLTKLLKAKEVYRYNPFKNQAL